MATGSTNPLTPAIRLLLVALPLAACEAGEIRLVGPDDAAGSDNTVELHVTIEDAALAEDLGWEAGVPGAPAEWAFVHQHRYLFRDAASDSAGVIRFEREGPGWHWVAAWREAEIDGERRVFGGGAKTTAARGASTDLSLRLDDPGTLVISEIYMDSPPPWEAGSYDGSKYIELYNNSPEVLYLDGLIVGKAYDVWRDLGANGHHSCDFTKPFRDDADAIWTRTHWRFPGSGTDHPIAPGEAVVVAVGAADHTAVHPSMLDLSGADFEFGSAFSADNPAAANMENVSSDYNLSAFYLSRSFWFLSDPVELSSLPTLTDEWRGPTYVQHRGFPADAIIDVSVQWWDTTSDPVIARNFPPCEHPIHPSFDALPGGYLNGNARPEDLLVAPQRQVVRTEAGRAILQDTNTSAVDFENRPRTPGWIP